MSESRIARLRQCIERDCEASWLALYGLASGCAQHEVISARLRRMDASHQSLSELIGDEQATEIVCEIYNRAGETFASRQRSLAPAHSSTRLTLRKVELLPQE